MKNREKGGTMKYENAMMELHENPPAPFNKEFLPGFGKMLEVLYTAWSDQYPGHTLDEGVAAHAVLVMACKGCQ